MSAEGARSTWTDERLDDLSDRMDDGFARVEARFDGLAHEMRALRTDLGERIDGQGRRLDARIDSQAHRIDALQRTMIQIGGGMIASILVGAAGIAATQL